jgi:hypothetical protein
MVASTFEPGVDLLLGHPDRGDLGVGEDVRRDDVEVQRRHGVAERVRHGDPALHGGHRREGQDAGAVARGIHPPHGGARDPVDDDVARRREVDADLLQAEAPVCGTDPTASSACEPVISGRPPGAR